jgi:hypothetical protein
MCWPSAAWRKIPVHSAPRCANPDSSARDRPLATAVGAIASRNCRQSRHAIPIFTSSCHGVCPPDAPSMIPATGPRPSGWTCHHQVTGARVAHRPCRSRSGTQAEHDPRFSDVGRLNSCGRQDSRSRSGAPSNEGTRGDGQCVQPLTVRGLAVSGQVLSDVHRVASGNRNPTATMHGG